jgi:hypothetical protein
MLARVCPPAKFIVEVTDGEMPTREDPRPRRVPPEALDEDPPLPAEAQLALSRASNTIARTLRPSAISPAASSSTRASSSHLVRR